MAYTSSATSSQCIALDGAARTAAARLVPEVASRYIPPPRRAYLGTPPPVEAVDHSYVLTGAATVGLNRWTLPASPPVKPESFEPQKGELVELVEVHFTHGDLARAEALSNRIMVPVEMILSCAVCTGLAMLAGDATIRGPFEV